MKIIAIYIFILLFGFTLKSYAQVNDFKDVLTKPLVGLVVRGKDTAGIEYEKTFLGTIKDSDSKVVFFIVKEFYTAQCAITKHGHSLLLFFDKEKKLVATYDFNAELPYELKNNILYFKYEDDNSHQEKIHGDTVSVSIPKCICVEPDNNCYFPE